jgi:hypothetical protein
MRGLGMFCPKGPHMLRNLIVIAMLAAFLRLGADAAYAAGDPPGRVGRIAYIEGAVSFHTAGQQAWSPAPLNYPVIAGESFWTEPGARLELQVGAAAIRLDDTTALDVIALNDRSTRLFLAQGALNLHLEALPPGGVEIATPRGEVRLLDPGTYHIAASDAADTAPGWLQTMVLDGRARMSGLRSGVEILAGESAVLQGDPPRVTLSEASATDFDNWALARDERERTALSYLSPETTGAADLDAYGNWSSDPGYGAVWFPTAVAADWAPYRYGHWAWVPPWGWTWIDDAPWGFAPFHYGRWVEIDGRWGWCPGERVARPIYAPALVAFIGGAEFGIALAAGPALPAVGWVPLAPHEIYRPDYPASITYIRNVNVTSVSRTEITSITKVTVVNNVTMAHFHNNAAATVVPAAAFTGAAPVQKAVVAVPREHLAEAHVAPRLNHLQPSAASRAGAVVPAAATVPEPHAPAQLAPPRTVPAALPPGNAAAKSPAASPIWRPDSERPAPHAPAPLPPEVRGPTAPSPPRPAAPSGPSAKVEPQTVMAKSPPHSVAVAPRPPTAVLSARPAAVDARPAPPRAVAHPVQQTQLAPTPQGWVRKPVAAAPHQAAPPAHAPAHGQPQAKDQGKPGGRPDDRHPGG